MAVRVLDLSVTGPAYESGIRVGDRIYMVNGCEVNSPADISRVLRGLSTAEETPVRYRRGDGQAAQRLTAFMRIGRGPGGKLTRLGIVTDPNLVGRHFKARSATRARPAANKPVASNGSGVAVLKVKQRTAVPGLRVGDILVSINGRGISKSEDVADAVKAANASAYSTVTFLRQGVRQTLSARFGRRAAGGFTRLGVVTRPECL